jgi:hypothetical protein
VPRFEPKFAPLTGDRPTPKCPQVQMQALRKVKIATLIRTMVRCSTMTSEPDLLHIEVVDNEIIVSLPKSQLSVTYHKSEKSPQLLAKRITEKYDPRTPMTVSEFLAKAWKLAKARELGWIV